MLDDRLKLHNTRTSRQLYAAAATPRTTTTTATAKVMQEQLHERQKYSKKDKKRNGKNCSH
jgi:hypothetical protein